LDTNRNVALEQTELFLGHFLRWGVLTSASILLAGLLASFLAPEWSASVTRAGIVLLIALPIARVAVTLVIFFIQRDFIYVGITAFVLAVLLLSLFLGRSAHADQINNPQLHVSVDLDYSQSM
jgi:uncharacterized membrane protein